jgi:hypothetical protein
MFAGKKCQQESHKCGNDCSENALLLLCGSCVGSAMSTTTLNKAQNSFPLTAIELDIDIVTVANSSLMVLSGKPPKLSFYL